MFCGKCGTKNPDENNFCMKCGHPLSSVERNDNIINSASEVKASSINITKLANIFKTFPKKVLFGGFAAIGLLIISIVLFLKASHTVNLNKYLTIEVSGYNGYGKADYEIDWDAIEKKYGSQIALTSEGIARLDSVNSFYSLGHKSIINKVKPIDVLKEAVRVELDEKNDLSNGKSISYIWKIDEDLAQYFDFKLKCKDGTHKVTELKELKTFDVFSDVNVEFSGISPKGSAEINYTGTGLSEKYFLCNKWYGLSEGDKIIVSLDSIHVEDCAELLGMVPEKLEKEYTVQGLDSYLSNVNQLDESTLQSMKDQAISVYKSSVEQGMGEGEDLLSLTYIGNYLLTSKNNSYNYLYLVYKAHIHNYYSDGTQSYDQITDQYWYIKYEDLLFKSDGTLIYDLDYYHTPNHGIYVDTGISYGWFGTYQWNYPGYDSLSALYDEEITIDDSYNHIDNIDESSVPVDKIPETAPVASTVITNSSDYILPNSATEIISQSALSGFDAEKCRLARNEIYARHGRKFADDALQAYFNSKAWYKGTIEPGAFQDERELSNIEINNRNIIMNYETAMGFN